MFILGVRLPASSRSIYSYFVDMDSGNFLPWDLLVPTTQSLIEKGVVLTIGETMGVGSGETQQNKSKDQEIVPTVDTVRYMFLSSLLLINKNPILLTGTSFTSVLNRVLFYFQYPSMYELSTAVFN